MGKIGEEITQKIKSAVKAKLIELGVEVDNELPDYIMVLVANKKTQVQMEGDLQLFLGANTVLFTSWLLNVLKKLEEVTVSKKNLKTIEVNNEDKGLVVTKQEKNEEQNPLLDRPVMIKVEPGTSVPETIEISVKDLNDEAENIQKETEDIQGNVSASDNDSEEPSRDVVSPNQDEDSPPDESGDEGDASQDKSHDGKTDESKIGPETSQHSRETSPNELRPLESGRPKIVYGIREQIDEVMEKTINGNRRPRGLSGSSLDEVRNKSDDERFSSTENEFYRRRPSADRNKGESFGPYDSDRGNRRSPDNRRRTDSDFRRSPRRRYPDYSRRSPDDRNRSPRRRSPDNRKSSPFNRRRSPIDRRRSPVDRRRSPIDRRRSPIDRRRSPVDRRRSPIDRRRSPIDRRRSPIDRRRSPVDRRRSPINRRRSPIGRRSPEDDRGRKDDLRRLSPDRGRPKVIDAREILKRKSKQDDSHSGLSTNEDSHRSEKRRKVASLVQRPGSTVEKSSEPQIPSLVRVTPRPIRKDAIQPNKKLLLLAVADAEKSVSRPRSKRQDHQSPPPSSSHSRKRDLLKSDERRATKESHSFNSSYVPPEKIFITLTNNQKSTDVDNSGKYSVSREVSTRKLYDEDELLYEDQYFDYEQDESDEIDAAKRRNEYVPLPVKRVVTEKSIQAVQPALSAEPKCIISLESSPERSIDEWEESNFAENDKSQGMLAGGVSKGTESVAAAERLDEGFEWTRLGPAPVATVRPLTQGTEKVEKFRGEAVNKSLERCKYWPSCLSPNCLYYHPSLPCQLFPLCKSEKDCLFVHPDCKFGPDCLNPKCSFLHRPLEGKIVEEVFPVSDLPLPPAKPSAPPVVKCAYFPNCKNLGCKFWHPVKNCKFGRSCARSDCYFFHPTLVIPPKELLTWTTKT